MRKAHLRKVLHTQNFFQIRGQDSGIGEGRGDSTDFFDGGIVCVLPAVRRTPVPEEKKGNGQGRENKNPFHFFKLPQKIGFSRDLGGGALPVSCLLWDTHITGITILLS